jgi:hypothetical protein
MEPTASAAADAERVHIMEELRNGYDDDWLRCLRIDLGGVVRPGLEEWFKEETAILSDASVPYSVRMHQWKRLIQAQEGVVRVQSDGSIASPTDPEETRDAIEYLDRLRQIKVPR